MMKLPTVGQQIIALHKAGNERKGVVDRVFPENWRGTPPLVFYKDNHGWSFILRLGMGDDWEKYPREEKPRVIHYRPMCTYCNRPMIMRGEPGFMANLICTSSKSRSTHGTFIAQPAPGSKILFTHCSEAYCDMCYVQIECDEDLLTDIEVTLPK
jgi:hypothetical protein